MVSELQEVDGLLSLQRHFSGTLSIRTTIMDFRTFEHRVSSWAICSPNAKSPFRIRGTVYAWLDEDLGYDVA